MTDKAMKPSDEAMLPCPFCGNPVTLVERDKLFVFQCPETSPCIGVGFATYGKLDQRETAITAWNTRAVIDRALSPAMDNQPTADAATVERVARALEALIPSNIGTDNLSIPDGCTVPVDMTMGEIRAAKAALAAIRQLGPVERADDVAQIVAWGKAHLIEEYGERTAREQEAWWYMDAIERGEFRQSGEG